jgi:hypothetical protein
MLWTQGSPLSEDKALPRKFHGDIHAKSDGSMIYVPPQHEEGIMCCKWIHYMGRIVAQMLPGLVVQIMLGASPISIPPVVAVRTAIDSFVRNLVVVQPHVERASSISGSLDAEASSPGPAQPGQGWG